MELKDRKRSFDINKLSTEAADALSEQIGVKVRGICDEAAQKVNAILSVYGMSAKIAIAFDELPGKEAEKPKKKPGKPRKTKQINLNTQE